MIGTLLRVLRTMTPATESAVAEKDAVLIDQHQDGSEQEPSTDPA